MNTLKKVLAFGTLVLSFSFFFTPEVSAEAPTPTPTEISQPSEDVKVAETKLFIANVVDASDMGQYSKENNSNRQSVTLSIDVETSSGTRTDRVDTIFVFPNEQFKRPLRIGDQVLIESTKEFSPSSPITFVSYYRQNNLLIWSVLLMGLFLIVAGFKTNLKYLIIFLMTIVSGVIVVLFYRTNTYLTFGLVFLWQIVSTFAFAYRIFSKRLPSILLSTSVVAGQFIALLLVFVMNNISIFDLGFFDIFFPTINDAREVMIYVFAMIVTFPTSVVIAEQIISESIKIKREQAEITKIKLIGALSKSSLKTLNYIFLTFFGIFLAIFTGVIALATKEDVFLQALNSTVLSQFLSIGFLILFELLVLVPAMSALVGVVLGNVETHELVTDKNLRQLEL